MKTILEILGISCFAVLFAEASGVMQWIKWRLQKPSSMHGIIAKINWFYKDPLYVQKNSRRLKPLDCPMCLAWWIGLLWFGIQMQNPVAIFYAATCSILAIIISKLLIKLT